MISGLQALAALALAVTVSSCGPKPKPKEEAKETAPAQEKAGALLRVGSVTIYQSDLDHHLKEKYPGRQDEGTRKQALDELATRAQFVQAALDASLDQSPAVRAEISRVLASRVKEEQLFPRLKEITAPIPETRLRELYAAKEAGFSTTGKRQLAVLWLDPHGSPERETQYREKLAAARDWFFKNGDLKDHPEQGFSVLGVDYSEHQASRYKQGIVGWLERAGGMDAWTKAVAEIGFSLTEAGQVSEVISRPEGVFLVRYMAEQPATQRSFESVSGDLDRAERQRLRREVESRFEDAIKTKYPVQRLTPPH